MNLSYRYGSASVLAGSAKGSVMVRAYERLEVVLPKHLEIQVDRVMSSAEKSVVAQGTLEQQPVVVKASLDPHDAYWQGRFVGEIRCYRVFERHPPPIVVPGLRYTDERQVLVLEHIEAAPVDSERYPDQAVSQETTEVVVTALEALRCWRAPPGALEAVDYSGRIERYHRAGLLTERDRRVLEELLESAGLAREPNHGDPLPTNILITGEGACALVDWEFAGLYVPGWDLALLHTLLIHSPSARTRIEELVALRGIGKAFLLNKALVLARERRIHRDLPTSDLREARLNLLDAEWESLSRW